jgi:hypothetical protein
MACASKTHNEQRYPLDDARGIFCASVCDNCEDEVRKRYRADIFEDSNYWSDEAVEAD